MDAADDSNGGEGETAVEDAYSLVASETRTEILLELWKAEDPLTFSELRERVGLRDSGQFNYHLDKLVDQYVRKTEEGYELRYAGTRVVGSVYSGVFTREMTVEPVDCDGTCFECEGTLQAYYEDDKGIVECSDCETTIVQFSVPPGILEGRNHERIPALFDRWARLQLQQAVDGFCPLCLGELTPSLVTEHNEILADINGVNFECERCGFEITGTVGSVILHHPTVVAFHEDHGVDLSERKLWNLEWLFEGVSDVLEEDPLRLDVTIPLDGEQLELRVGGGFEVLEAERTARTEP